MMVNEQTAVVEGVEGEFRDVNWEDTNVSDLSISIEQVKWFLECANGGVKLKVYNEYQKAQKYRIEDEILQSLWDEYIENRKNVS